MRIAGKNITIVALTIAGSDDHGILVLRGGDARIVESDIDDNKGCGIFVNENSSARIGFLSFNDTFARANSITNNGNGICVQGSSQATIVGNDISNNLSNGIRVSKVSQAGITSNTINGNGFGNPSCGNNCNGIIVFENSGVNLGSNTPGTIFDDPNDTNPLNKNFQFGVRCTLNSYVSGHTGTLDGATSLKGGTSTVPPPAGGAFSGSCSDNTTVP